jgi:hypothetical protein
MLYFLKKSFFIFLLTFSSNAFAQEELKLILDKDFSAYSAAEDIYTIHNWLVNAERNYLKEKWTEENSFGKKSAGVLYRLGKTVLLDNCIDYLAFLSQHEVFGHGAWYRKLGHEENTYMLSLPPPYGNGAGLARSGKLNNIKISKHESNAKVAGGNEAAGILSKTIEQKFMMTQQIDYRDAVLYLLSVNNLAAYIYGTRYKILKGNSNDIDAYIQGVNISENKNHLKKDYNINVLSWQALITALNPYQIFSLWTYCKTYLWNGESKFQYPSLRIQNFFLMPVFRMNLAPFGTEFYMDNYVKTKQRMYCIYFRSGDNRFSESYGFGGSTVNLISLRRLGIDCKADIWKQPSLSIGGKSITQSKSGFGGMGTLCIKLNPGSNNFPLSLIGNFSYKSTGYIPGEMLGAGFIFSGGLAIKTSE